MADTPSRRFSALRLAGYVVLTLVTFCGALWQTLPYAEMSQRVELELQNHGVGAEVRGLGPGALFGCAADRLTLYPLGQTDLRWDLSSVILRPLVRRLLVGEGAASLVADSLGGKIQATGVWQQPPRVDANWQDLLLKEIPLPAVAEGLPLAGRVSGSLSTQLDPEDPIRAESSLEAQLRDVAIGSGTVQGIPVPAVRLGDGTFRVKTADQKVEVETAEFRNGDIEVSFSGNIFLLDDLPRSRVNGILSLRPNEQAAEELALLFAVFPGDKGSDGRYVARVGGSLGAPRLSKRR